MLVFAVFARTIGFGLFNDDYFLLRPWTSRQVLNAFHGQFDQVGYDQTYYRPLASVSFSAEWGIWGTTRWGYHLTNIAIHAGAVVLLWLLLRRLRVTWWAALAGAAFFALVPANVAAVAYIAERTDAMVGLLVCGVLLCVWRYSESRKMSWLLSAVGLYIISLLCKEVATATVPFVAAFWLYLRMQDGDVGGSEPTPAGVLAHWAAEARAVGRGLRSSWTQWVRTLGPFVIVTIVYLIYRSAVLPADSLSGRVLKGLGPVRSVFSGFKYTVEGVPWEIHPLPFIPIAVAFVLGFVLQPRSPAWRVVLLGFCGIVSGVLPLAPSGSVEPRGLYVAEIGFAIAIAGLATVFGTAFVDRRRYAGVARAAIVGVSVAVAATVAVSHVQSQNLYEPGSAASLSHDLDTWTNPPFRVAVIPPANLREIEKHLRDAGLIDAAGNVIVEPGDG